MSKQINTNVKIKRNEYILTKAKEYKKELLTSVVYPQSNVEIIEDHTRIHRLAVRELSDFVISEEMAAGDEFILDFGNHYVGTMEFDIESAGSPADAPLLFEIRYGEMPVEIAADYSDYDGWISRSWLQDYQYHIDVLPHRFVSERRNSFRYVRIKVIATSEKYRVVFKNVKLNYCSAVSNINLEEGIDKKLNKINEVSVRTLQNCMQDVFEDGPKRDRRLWLGDLYLQAQANYHSFNNYDLVKRCLYLFAGVPDQDGRVCANLFVKPNVIADDTYLFDYSLHFINTLADYYVKSQDRETVQDLYETAKKQIAFAETHINSNNLVEERDYWWAFFDWQDDLKKATAAQGLYLFTLKNMLILAKEFDLEYVPILEKRYSELKSSALKYLYDENLDLFICDEQVSWHSQIWMILADVVEGEDAEKLLKRALNHREITNVVTPFAQHFLVEAYLKVGDKCSAIKLIKEYWGTMVDLGADTFWELFNQKDLEFSPYGSHLANSYCHAWSCTPVYLISQYNLN